MLKAIFGAHVFGDSPAPLAAADGPAETVLPDVQTFDIKQAIDSYVQLRQRLEAMIRSEGREPLDAIGAAATDRCALGRWLQGEARSRYGHLPIIAELEAAHAALHQRSGSIVTLARQGRRDQALAELLGVEFSRATARLKSLLARVYVDLLAAEPALATAS